MKKSTLLLILVWLSLSAFTQTTLPLSNSNEFIAQHSDSGLSDADPDSVYILPGTNAVNLMSNFSVTEEPKNKEKAAKATSNLQSVVAPQGWSGLSSYLIPDNPNIENLFLPVQNQLIILYNQQGIYYPSQQLNTLVNWNSQSGYIAKFNQATNVEFSGQLIQNRTLSLAIGWNLIPVLSSCPVNVETLFANAGVAVIKEVAGFKLYWPGMGINSLQELLPGNAYYVMMNSPANISFPDCGAPAWQCGEVLVDTRDGQSYNTVQIGSQCWMAENLNIGTKIPGTTEMADNGIIEKYCYNNSEANCDVYGGLYKWDEMMQYSATPGVQGLCPTGWHLPTDPEWTTLTDFLGPTVIVGGKMKATGTIEAGTGLWYAPNGGATNSSGFTALPAGYHNNDGTFNAQGSFTLLWSSTESQDIGAWSRGLYHDGAPIYSGGYYKYLGFSVRCVNDTPMPVWSCGQPLPDHRDGKTYNTVQIGAQCWMAENLNIGTMIPGTIEMANNSIMEKYCYDNNPTNCNVYGGLYQWDEMMDYSTTPGVQGLCPAGWHIPEDAEWAVLSDFLGGDNFAGGKMKEAGTSHWSAPNIGATNSSGFTGLPGGYRTFTGSFGLFGTSGLFWGSTEDSPSNALLRYLYYNYANLNSGFNSKGYGFSVRCVKGEYINQPPSIPSTPQPSDGAMNQPVNTTILWTCSDPENDVLTFDVYFGTTNPPAQVSTGQSGETFDPGVLGFSTSYYWKIVAHDNYVDNYVNKTEGPVWSFTTTVPQAFNCGNPLLDTRDNQTYNTVQIGTQCWMAENLNVGTMISGNTYMANNSIIEKYCFNDDPANCNTYGGLYQWSEMMQYSTAPGEQGICPEGWHIPADTEWTRLTTFLGGENVAGGKMKASGTIEAGTGLWADPNTGATNSSGFSALPGGMDYYGGYFSAMGYDAYFWSSTESNSSYPWYRYLDYYATDVFRISDHESNGFSVRCVREIPPAWSCGDPLPDTRDNQIYNTVQIGTQCWMAENLNVGTMIPGSTEMEDNSNIEKYCYNDNPANCNTYGGLYQWSEMMQYSTAPGVQGLCPAGWHLPADEEWSVLTDYLGGEVSAGGKLKTTGTTQAGTGLWSDPNTGATNESGFSALPASRRDYYGYFYNQDYYTYFWSSTASDEYYILLRQLDYDKADVTRSAENKGNGFSVRCVREIPPPAWSCGQPFPVTHTTGDMAPVNKTIDYGTVETNLTGSNKCWITQNLGSDHQAVSDADATEESAGWYWQFNTKQGFMHDGANRTPNTSWIYGMGETSEWLPENDPCTLLLGTGWRLPTYNEWNNADVNGGWNNSPQAYESLLKLHMAGYLDYSSGDLISRGSTGLYWSNSHISTNYGWSLLINSSVSDMYSNSKYYGFNSRCLNDTYPPAWSCGNPMNDTRDNQTYNTVQIGTQCWMAENLNIGAMIPGNTDMANNSIAEKYCYNNIAANCDTYGGLYQWNEMMQYSTMPGVQGLCPAGWHLPADAEWTILSTFLGGESIAGGTMKSTGTIEAGTGLWYDPNGGATNESGFSALPGGIRFFDGSFGYLGYTEIYSNSSESDANYHWGRYLSSDFPQIFSSGYYNKNEGYSVRCLKD